MLHGCCVPRMDTLLPTGPPASYNAVNGVPTCASNFGLNLTIRGRYGRGDGVFIVSDYGAVGDGFNPHKYCQTADECTALSLKSGVDQDGGGADYDRVASLVQEGLLTEAEVRRCIPTPVLPPSTPHNRCATPQVRLAASRLFAARIELGLLDPPETTPFLQVRALPPLTRPSSCVQVALTPLTPLIRACRTCAS